MSPENTDMLAEALDDAIVDDNPFETKGSVAPLALEEQMETSNPVESLPVMEIPKNESVFSAIQAQIETLGPDEVGEKLKSLLEIADYSYFHIGGVLNKIQKNNWYVPHLSFKEWVENETDLSYRKAVYLTAIYRSLVDSEITWEQVKDLGWTKLKELVPVLTKENVSEWVDFAKDKTNLQINAAVKNSVMASNEEGESLADGKNPSINSGSSEVTTMTFKVHPDQKDSIKLALEKAMEEASTEYPAVALDHICLDYCNSITNEVVSEVKVINYLKELNEDNLKALLKKAGFQID